MTRYGAQELTIEALCGEMKLTKGSFYHHFRGIDEFIDRFLLYFEQEGTLQIIDVVNREPDPPARLRRLVELSTAHPPQLEVAMRAWAQQDDLVEAAFERVDQQRIAYLTELWRPLVNDHETGVATAQTMYAILIGGQQLLPPLSQEAHRTVFEASDDHLDAYLAVIREQPNAPTSRFLVVTIVHYRRWTGPLYFNVIRPFHHLVVQQMGRAGSKGSES